MHRTTFPVRVSSVPMPGCEYSRGRQYRRGVGPAFEAARDRPGYRSAHRPGGGSEPWREHFWADSEHPPGSPRSIRGSGQMLPRWLRPEHRSSTRSNRFRDYRVCRHPGAERKVHLLARPLPRSPRRERLDTGSAQRLGVGPFGDPIDGADHRCGAFQHEDVDGARPSQQRLRTDQPQGSGFASIHTQDPRQDIM